MNDLVKAMQLPALRQLQPGEYAYTLDPTSKRGRELLAVACRGKPASIKKAANTTIEVEHLVYYTFDKIDKQSGEVKRLPRLVVIAPNGSMFAMSGWKAIEDVLFPCSVLGIQPPFKPPLRFAVSMITCGDEGREYAALEWVMEVKK